MSKNKILSCLNSTVQYLLLSGDEQSKAEAKTWVQSVLVEDMKYFNYVWSETEKCFFDPTGENGYWWHSEFKHELRQASTKQRVRAFHILNEAGLPIIGNSRKHYTLLTEVFPDLARYIPA